MDPALHPLWTRRLESSGTESFTADRRSYFHRARRVRNLLAPDASARNRARPDRYPAHRVVDRDSTADRTRDWVRSGGLGQALPSILHRDAARLRRVRDADGAGWSSDRGQPADAVDWRVGARQYRRLVALDCGAGVHALAASSG